METGGRLLSILLKVSEKAANIARACRQNDALFKLLVQEKSEEEKNPRFFQDFKTLADVLIQETIRHDIELEFPELAKVVQGEENNIFSNALGESIVVQVCPTIEETTQLLAKVMGSDIATAELLATEVHKDIQFLDVPTVAELPLEFNINLDDLGIWIDPIDSTADYINGGEKVDETTGIHLSGLRCVTVLIGAYLKTTGMPVLGVINQPFYTNIDSRWKGNCYWGFVDNDNIGKFSVTKELDMKKVVVLSRVEDMNVKSKLLDGGFTLVEAAGAGYKILNVALGQADIYILSKASTYKWDTCGPHALLRSLDGGLIEFQSFLNATDSNYTDIKYISTSNFSNSNGLIAYRNTETLETLKSILCE